MNIDIDLYLCQFSIHSAIASGDEDIFQDTTDSDWSDTSDSIDSKIPDHSVIFQNSLYLNLSDTSDSDDSEISETPFTRRKVSKRKGITF